MPEQLLCTTSWVHPRKAGLCWVGLLRPGVGTEVGQETLRYNGDNNTHQLLKACCVLQFHWVLYAHYFMDSHNNLTSINNEHIHFPHGNAKTRKMNQPFPRSSVLFGMERSDWTLLHHSQTEGELTEKCRFNLLVVKMIQNMELWETPEAARLPFRFLILIMPCHVLRAACVADLSKYRNHCGDSGLWGLVLDHSYAFVKHWIAESHRWPTANYYQWFVFLSRGDIGPHEYRVSGVSPTSCLQDVHQTYFQIS